MTDPDALRFARYFILAGWLSVGCNLGVTYERANRGDWIGAVGSFTVVLVASLAVWFFYVMKGKMK